MNWIKAFDLFLFDFDGLLVNTEHIHYQAYINMCKNRGFDLDWSFDLYCQIAHTSQEGLKLAIYAKFPNLFEQQPLWEVLYEEKKKKYFELLQSVQVELMPGVKELLKILEENNKKKCVVTHSLKSQVDLIKANSPILKTIPYWITREDYLNPKPDAECYLKAIQLYGEKGDKIIGFEDSYRGLMALAQTPVKKAVLICHAHHPQLDVVLPENTIHFESFLKIPANQSFF